jgi:hypothetical protein
MDEPGRPTKRTDANRKTIIDAIEQGTPYRHAAAMAGMSEDTFGRWRNDDADFADAIKEAEGRAVAGRLARIRVAEPTHWQAAAWWLERKYPAEFGRTVQDVNVGGQKDGNPLRIVIERITPDAKQEPTE